MPKIMLGLLALVALVGFVSCGTRDVAVAAPATPTQERVLNDLQSSHIDGNVPPAADFQAFLVRDLTAYLSSKRNTVGMADFTLLRDGPTQSGVALPKFYVWVKARTSRGESLEGAARVAAVDKTRFEVTDFLSAKQIQDNPSEVEAVFPAPLVANILERANRVK